MKKLFFKKWLQKISLPKKSTRLSVGYLYTPLIAMIVFALAMGFILWTLQNQEKNQQNSALYRELAIAKQRIQINFSENEEQVLNLSKTLASTDKNPPYASGFIQDSRDLVGRHPEIIQVRWLENGLAKPMTYPAIKNKEDWITPVVKQTLDKELQKILLQARETGHPQYGELVPLNIDTGNSTFNSQRSWVFWYVLPAANMSDSEGSVAVLYSAHNMLVDMIPKEFTSRYRFSIVSSEGDSILSVSNRNLPKNTLKHEISIDKIAGNLYLRGESYPPPSNLAYRMLLWLVIGLCLFIIWSLWSIWQHMRFRQEIQKSLVDETNFRRAIEESMPLGIRVHDMDARITYVNPAFAKMVGWSTSELVGLAPPFPFWPEKDLPDIMKKMQSAMASRRAPANGIEATILTKSGQRLSTRTFISPLINSSGIQSGWISSVIDISEPKKIREELAASHHRFTTVLEGLDAAVSVVNPKNGDLLFANGLYREQFGNSSDGHIQLVGGELELSESGSEQFDEEAVDSLAGLPSSMLNPINGDAREVQLPDSNTWYEVRRRYIPWTDGHLAQLIIATDVTHQHNAEEHARLQEEKMQFSSRLTTMGEMASSLAHELNQPLAAINNYCNGAISRLKSRDDESLSKEIIPALEKAGNQAMRAGHIIQRIKSFVKRSAPQRELCSIEQIINDAVELVDIEANRQSLHIQTSLARDLPECFVDPILIQQVLVNLIKNSLDSMRDTHTKMARFKAAPIKVLADVDASHQPAMLRIRVMDSGGGIPESVINQIYEPFFSTKSDGMGMGLNICRSIIESHEGRLWAENRLPVKNQSINSESVIQKPVGCTFTILLPFEQYSAKDHEFNEPLQSEDTNN